MAVFGLPTAHGDDPARAIAAGLELRDRVRESPDLGERLPIRVALNTGEVVASANAEAGGDFLLTGDAVNVAARLVQWAEPWRVVAGERTARAAPEFAYGATEAVEAKGKSVAVAAAEVISRRALQPKAAPLFGRDDDIAQLELLARRSLGDRRPYLVTIVAPAGTGKTRLLEAFEERLARQLPDVLVVTAQCLPYGQRLTFWPLRGVLFGLFDLTDDMSNDVVRARVIERLAELDVNDHEATASRLLATIGASEDETDDRSVLFAAWRELFERFASRQPLVIVFEDIHWSSDVFLDLVEYVTQPRGELPLMMLALTRPELLDRRPNWGGGRRNHLSIELAPLDDEAIQQLVQSLLGSAPPGRRRSRRTSGRRQPVLRGRARPVDHRPTGRGAGRSGGRGGHGQPARYGPGHRPGASRQPATGRAAVPAAWVRSSVGRFRPRVSSPSICRRRPGSMLRWASCSTAT